MPIKSSTAWPTSLRIQALLALQPISARPFIEHAKAVTVPALVVQVHNHVLTKPSDVQRFKTYM